MMNFYYDPILGLQYIYLGGLFIFDLKNLPKDIDVEKFLEDWKYHSSQIGIQPLEPYHNVEIVGQITEYKL